MQTGEDKEQSLRCFIRYLLDACFKERDYRKVGSCTAENVMCVGLRLEEVGRSRFDLEHLLKSQVDLFPSVVEYFIQDEVIKNFGGGVWHYYGQIGLRAAKENWGIVRYVIRLMATVRETETGWEIIAIHTSEAGSYGEHSQKITLSSQPPQDADHPISQKELGAALNQLLPGGIVSRSSSQGFPIAYANSQFLRMSGYSSFSDLAKACGNSFLRLIHKDDIEKYLYTVKFMERTGKQCECDYRIRRFSGSYLWLHDVGRRAVTGDGKVLFVSVITDISQRVERLEVLEKESELDFLTNVYNRKGAAEKLKIWEESYSRSLLLIIDLDNFKKVNDIYGHSIGDKALQFAAALLSDTYGTDGVVSRIGGDEFSVYLPNYPPLDQVEQQLQTICTQYRTRLQSLAPASGSTLSIGGVYGSNETPYSEKFQIADKNLYTVKKHSKNGMQITCCDL